VFALAGALTRRLPFATVPLGGQGNLRGAESVLTAETGYPFAVDFSAGYPRFGPGEFDAASLLAAGATDAVLLVGADARDDLPEAAFEALHEIPKITVDFRDGDPTLEPRAAIRCAPYGVAAPATVYRSDGIALRARPALESPLPTDADVLRRLAERLARSPRVREAS
jgi:formylmethanofuran dehydrogenase subunit B